VPPRTKHPEASPEGSFLPPGQRDRSGFWFPLGYEHPRTLVRRRAKHSTDPGPSRRAETGGHDDVSLT
jgi:hypothetical protein